jgi:uncharacterized membrane protein
VAAATSIGIGRCSRSGIGDSHGRRSYDDAIAASPFLDPAPAGQVWARRTIDAPRARLDFREHVGTTLWFIPSLFVIGAFALSKLTVVIDHALSLRQAPSWLLGANADAAASLTATVATAMLTFLGVVFSTTLVAIQLAGGQYSPRIVRVFIRSRLTHVTLGVFLATFVFALNGLVEVQSGVDPLVPAVTISMVYVLLLSTLAMFVAFLHGMAQMLRVQYLLTRVTKDGRVAMLQAFPPAETYALAPAPPWLTEATGTDGDASVVVRNGSAAGVLQAVDRTALAGLAAQHDAQIELLVEVGEYLAVATPIARVHAARPGARPSVTGDDVAASFLLGAERTLLQDPGFVFRQLVDVAIRALSPSVNDPTTAVQAIDRMVDLLATVASRPDPSGWFVDEAGAARLHCREPDIGRLVELAFVEIIRYGADSPQVVRRLRAAFDVLEGIERPDVVATIEGMRGMLDQTEAQLMPAAFTGVSAVPDRHGLG